jgi:protein-tyrosine phosphatase
MKRVLFLCSGNYYRSRFAEALFNAVAAHHRLPWQAISRGLSVGHPGNIGPISPFAVEGLEYRGVPMGTDPREPMQVTRAELEAADLVVALKEAEHRPLLDQLFPGWAGRVTYWHIDDLDCAGPAEALEKLDRQLIALLTRLFKEELVRKRADGER